MYAGKLMRGGIWRSSPDRRRGWIYHQYCLSVSVDQDSGLHTVLFIDRHNRAVGAVHSGREGTRKNIAGKL
jgi:hypothetical protein